METQNRINSVDNQWCLRINREKPSRDYFPPAARRALRHAVMIGAVASILLIARGSQSQNFAYADEPEIPRFGESVKTATPAIPRFGEPVSTPLPITNTDSIPVFGEPLRPLIPLDEPVSELVAEPAPASKFLGELLPDNCEATQETYGGIASYYSKDEGCLGCTGITATGEYYNDGHTVNGIPTLAMNAVPLNTMVLVTNQHSEISRIARVNDRGYFDRDPWYRIADLSRVLKEQILGSDLTPVLIRVINCFPH